MKSESQNRKKPLMQRFLGVCNFYRPTYVYAPRPPSQEKDSKNNPLWSDLTSPLYDMTQKTFNWDESTWTEDYRGHFRALQQAIISASCGITQDLVTPSCWLMVKMRK